MNIFRAGLGYCVDNFSGGGVPHRKRATARGIDRLSVNKHLQGRVLFLLWPGAATRADVGFRSLGAAAGQFGSTCPVYESRQVYAAAPKPVNIFAVRSFHHVA